MMTDGTSASDAKQDAEAAKLNAEAAKIAAEARKIELETDVARWRGLVPDFGAVKAGKTDLPAEKVGRSALLGWMALESAAEKLVAEAIFDQTLVAKGSGVVVLVTSDPDLTSLGAAYLEVKTSTDAVLARATEVLKKYRVVSKTMAFAPTLIGAATAVAGALPGLISLFGTDRSETVIDLARDDEAVIAMVCGKLLKHGALSGITIVDDRFRLVERTGIWSVLRDLNDARTELAGVRAEQAPPGTEPPKPGTAKAKALAEIESAIAAIVGMEVSLRSVPAGRVRSPIVEAALYERLFEAQGTADGFTHVLHLRALGGQVSRDVVDRPAVFGSDTLNILAEAAISYRLLKIESNALVASGLVSGSAQAFGKPGGALRFEKG
jgi:hypothetical protein